MAFPFEPCRGLSNGHLQTIVGNFLPRPAFRLAAVSETVEVDPADGSRVLCHCHWQAEPERAKRLTVVLVHGLEGSSDSRYIQGIAARAWDGRLECRPDEYAHLRRHGDADSHALSLRTLGRRGRGGAPLCRAIRPGAGGAGGLLDGRQPGAKAGRRVGQPAAARAPWPRSARPSIWPPAPTPCTSRSTAATSGAFCAT